MHLIAIKGCYTDFDFMISKTKIQEALFQAIDEINEFLPQERRLKKSSETALRGQKGLDSIQFVRFVVAAEEAIAEGLGVSLSLVSEKAFSSKTSPFATVESLSDFVGALIKSQKDG